MACGGIANAALTESGRVFTWGSSDDGGLGRPGGPDAPEQFPGEVRGAGVGRRGWFNINTLCTSLRGVEWIGWAGRVVIGRSKPSIDGSTNFKY